MNDRCIQIRFIVESVDNYQIIEAYPDDEYYPSFLVYSQFEGERFHVLFAADVEYGNIRVFTAYHPNPDEWDISLKNRRTS